MYYKPFGLLALTLAATSDASPARRGPWQQLAPIPFATRQEHTTVAISPSTLAIVGGIIPDNSTIGAATTNIMQLYDTIQDEWRLAASAPMAANHPNVAALDAKVYLLGGMNGSLEIAWEGFPESFVYDSATDCWQPLEPMPNDERRGSAAMGVYKQIIYLAGGLRRLDLESQITMDIVSAFDTTSGTWIALPEAARRLPEGRDHAGSAVVGHHFYVLGGRKDGMANVKDAVFILDLEDLESGWRTSTGRMPTPRGGLSAGTIGSVVYTFGGEGNSAEGSNGVFNETEAFDTKTETWTELQAMAVPRHGTSAVAVGRRVIIPGGGIVSGGYPVSVVDAYWPC